MLKELHGLLPFVAVWDTDLPLSVLAWLDKCEKSGLINWREHGRLLRAIKETEGIYD